MGACGPASASRKLTTPLFQRRKQPAGLLISYFDASSKAFDSQSKNPGSTLVRVANLTREASMNEAAKAVSGTPVFTLARPRRATLRQGLATRSGRTPVPIMSPRCRPPCERIQQRRQRSRRAQRAARIGAARPGRRSCCASSPGCSASRAAAVVSVVFVAGIALAVSYPNLPEIGSLTRLPAEAADARLLRRRRAPG